ncbi:hypothetical protein SteCoe_14874 [Stentor coeruleus]|uniref:FCP1 homology domain-containing protein n=1 Tax=Stentor coeruleus TaxID=5963 RepID=A0A1R2C4W7_9CILI|nr:hypothetical protein SteCoe_14874 [Stentor coeruleus]
MKTSRGQRSQPVLQGNIMAKSNKLAIEVPDDDDDEEFVANKFNKNSPSYGKGNDGQRSESIFAVKNKASTSTHGPKRCYGQSGTPKVAQKIFKFPSATKIAVQSGIPKPPNIYTTKVINKIQSQPSKLSSTPTYSGKVEENKSRPKSTTNSLKPITKENPKPSTSLNSLVTQVKSSSQTTKAISEKELQAKSEILYKEHLFQTFQAMKFIRTLPPVSLEQLKEKRQNIPRRKGYENKKTLVFDLDETLVHCCEDINNSNPMIILPIIFPTGETVHAGINIRPYALECLREVNKDFEVFVFTASHPCYANVVLDYLDPNKELIHQRFFRDSCVNMGGVFIKDLRIFANRSLKDLIIVDNAAYSFAYQIDNGIPIVSWHDDVYDKELYNLIDYVKILAKTDDIRDVNEKTFHLRTFYEDYASEFLSSDISCHIKPAKNV